MRGWLAAAGVALALAGACGDRPEEKQKPAAPAPSADSRPAAPGPGPAKPPAAALPEMRYYSMAG